MAPAGSSASPSQAGSRTFRDALLEPFSKEGDRVVEKYIQGREIQIAILNGKPLPSIEIIPLQGFYDYENKYQAGRPKSVQRLSHPGGDGKSGPALA